jgi:hypothetical protein
MSGAASQKLCRANRGREFGPRRLPSIADYGTQFPEIFNKYVSQSLPAGERTNINQLTCSMCVCTSDFEVSGHVGLRSMDCLSVFQKSNPTYPAKLVPVFLLIVTQIFGYSLKMYIMRAADKSQYSSVTL